MNRPLPPKRKPPLSKGASQDDILNRTPLGFSERMNPLMTPTPHAHAGNDAGFCKSYVPPRGREGLFDEMEEPDGSVRPHWMMFSSRRRPRPRRACAGGGKPHASSFTTTAVTYNVYGDPAGMDRPWEPRRHPCSSIRSNGPALETALIQRAHLLDLLLADIYGPQRPSVKASSRRNSSSPIAATSAPARARNSRKAAGSIKYAADVARSPDGQTLWIISDRTQAPSGAGYALENRLVLAGPSRTFSAIAAYAASPSSSAPCGALESLSPQNKDNPRRPAHARPVQRDLLRTRLPGPLPRLHPRRGRRPDGPRQQGLPQDPRRPAAGRCHSAPAG